MYELEGQGNHWHNLQQVIGTGPFLFRIELEILDRPASTGQLPAAPLNLESIWKKIPLEQ